MTFFYYAPSTLLVAVPITSTDWPFIFNEITGSNRIVSSDFSVTLDSRSTLVFAGLFPAMVGTLAVVTLSVGFAIPVGMASGVYMAEYSRGGVKMVLGLFFDILP